MSSTPIIIPVILCGGQGSRLWPMSRVKFPKQFIDLGVGEKGSLLEQTAKRLANIDNIGKPVVISNREHRFLVAEHLQRAGYDDASIILEPKMRNTAPAIAAAALHIRTQYGENALMLVLPSDHVNKNDAAFADGVARAARTAQSGKLVTFGITPEYAETGYGYIRVGDSINADDQASLVAEFVEKPDAATAEKYVKSGEYLWNGGMFMFPVTLLLQEMAALQPDVLRHVDTALEEAERDQDFIRLDDIAFSDAPNISIDYAVMEKTKNAAVVALSCGWSDAGAWDALWRIGEKDAAGNVCRGETYAMKTKNSYIHADGAPIAVLGLDNIVVVSTADMILVADKNNAQDVKTLMSHVGESNKQKVEHHARVYRPWGFYETIELQSRHQVKHIQVRPGAKLSVQMHHHRSEHWIITDGTAKVTLDGVETILSENQYVYIPLAAVHSIENIGQIPLNFVEVQHGSYLGEDDIVRFSDMYGRAPEANEANTGKKRA